MATYLVTGATRGIGRALVNVLASDRLILVGRDPGALDAVCAPLPSATFFVADLATPRELARAFSDGGVPNELDGLVHAAGASRRGRLDEFGVEGWLELTAVNVIAVAELTRLALPALRRCGGTVVLLNSGAGISVPKPGGAAYAATKHALRAFADGLRDEEPALRVSSVFLGRVATDMQRALREYEGGSFRPEEYLDSVAVASFVAELLKLPKDVLVPETTMMPGAARPRDGAH